jgi:hypothetical protein
MNPADDFAAFMRNFRNMVFTTDGLLRFLRAVCGGKAARVAVKRETRREAART